MNRLHTALGLLTVAALMTPQIARAEAFTGGRGCTGFMLHTCAAVQVSGVPNSVQFSTGSSGSITMENPGLNSMGSPGFFSMGGNGTSNFGVQIHTIRSAEVSGFREDPFFVTTCPGHIDPTDCPPTVTPEPVSMTLIATGLMGITGFGAAARRRRNQARDL